jgi:hypothetical protein
MAQPYPGYGCEQVTIVASRIPDTIVAVGETRHNIYKHCNLRRFGTVGGKILEEVGREVSTLLNWLSVGSFCGICCFLWL